MRLYVEDDFKYVSESYKKALFERSSEYVFIKDAKDTSEKYIVSGVVIKLCEKYNEFELGQTIYSHILYMLNVIELSNVRGNNQVYAALYCDCDTTIKSLHNNLDINWYNSEYEKKNKLQRTSNLPEKYFVNKRIYNNEVKKGLDFIWIFALNQVEFLRNPRHMNNKPFSKKKALDKAAKNLGVDRVELENHFKARSVCVRWGKKDYNEQ